MGDSVAAPLPRRRAAASALASAAAREPTPGERAWLAVVPCVLIVCALALLLGPPLGHAFLAPRGAVFWPSVDHTQAIRPEPVEHARYLIALLGPVLLCVAIVSARWVRLPPLWIRRLLDAAQVTLLVALCTFLIAQRLHTYGLDYGGPLRRAYFTVPTLLAAAALSVALVVVLHRDRISER